MVGAFRREDSVTCPHGNVLPIGPHDALAFDEVIKFLQRGLALVGMAALADPSSQLPNLEVDLDVDVIVEKIMVED